MQEHKLKDTLSVVGISVQQFYSKSRKDFCSIMYDCAQNYWYNLFGHIKKGCNSIKLKDTSSVVGTSVYQFYSKSRKNARG